MVFFAGNSGWGFFAEGVTVAGREAGKVLFLFKKHLPAG